MIEDIYSKLSFPETFLSNRNLGKDQLLNSPNSYLINDDYKSIFNQYVNYVKIKYILDSKSINEKEDLIVLEIEINSIKCIYDISELLGRLILYPQIVFIKYKNRFKIGYIKNRKNKKNSSTNFVIDIYYTGWHPLSKNSVRKSELLSDLNFEKNYTDGDLLKKYENIIKKYISKHLELKEGIQLIKLLGLEYDEYTKKEIITNCICHKVREDITSELDYYSTNKMDKYEENNKEFTRIVIDYDEFYNFLKENYSNFRKSYNDYVELLNSIYQKNRIQKALSKYDNSRCKYYDEYNKKCLFLQGEKDCIGISKCDNYRRNRNEY